QEAVTHLERAVAHLRSRGVKAGVALNPATPVAMLEDILPELDYVLVMSVNPGFGGQKFLPLAIDKVRRVRDQVYQRGPKTQLEGGGGVDASTIRSLVEVGADVLVAGSAVFGQGDPAAAARTLLEAAR